MGPTHLAKSIETDGYNFMATEICKCVNNGGSPRGNASNETMDRKNDQADCGDQNASPTKSILPAISEKISCKNLTELCLPGQGIKLFPDTDDLSGLLTLDLSHNEIAELPPKLKSSTHLRVLNLSHNRLTEFPKVLVEGLAVMKNVNLSFNALKTLPRPACVQHLNELTARSCQLHDFPRWILFERHCVETLDLSMNPVFEHFPLDEKLVYHSSIKMLKKINFSNTYIFDRLRTLFAQLSGLEHLDVSNYGMKYSNRLLTCQEVFGPSLRVLKAVDLGLASNPSLEGCTRLEVLNLARNPMSWLNSDFPVACLRIAVLPNSFICSLPDNFGDMINLEYLNLSHNDVAVLPTSFVKLTRLKHLDLYQNSFSSLPEALESFKQITCLDLCQNYFEPPSHPLGDETSYEELRGALRSTLTEKRCNGIVPNKMNDLYLSDDGSGKYMKYGSSSGSSLVDTDDENCETPDKPVFIRPLPESQPDEDWDAIEPVMYQGEGHFSDQGLQRPFMPEYVSSSDLNQHFMQYLHLVPERIRNSPFYYHRIDVSSNLSSVRRFSRADVAEGQFDD